MWTKLVQERGVGQYLWDIQMGFLSPEAFMARDRGWLVPVRDQLLLPEVANGTNWLGGMDGIWGDKEKRFVLTFFSQSSASVSINRDFVSEAEFRSGTQLLDPKWKGKIASLDPLFTGGRGTFVILMEAYGEQFLRDLLSKQDIVVITDMRQTTEGVIRGRYPITLAVISDYLAPFREQGVGMNIVRLTEPLGLNYGSGTISIIERAPHPNAAKVFLNWLLTQDVQARLAKSLANNSRRLDVAPGDPEAVVDPARMAQYVAIQSEAALQKRERVGEIAQEIQQRGTSTP
jgi:iron(III) transport system substrate-binding protein